MDFTMDLQPPGFVWHWLIAPRLDGDHVIRLYIDYTDAGFCAIVRHQPSYIDDRQPDKTNWIARPAIVDNEVNSTQIAKFMGPIWGPPGPCRSQMVPMNLAIRVAIADVFAPE